jgi:hypothetical protein
MNVILQPTTKVNKKNKKTIYFHWQHSQHLESTSISKYTEKIHIST